MVTHTLNINEAIGVAGDSPDTAASYVRNLPAEGFDISEGVRRNVGKNLYSGLEVGEVFGKTLHRVIHETIRVRDTLLRNANAVIYDLIIRNDLLDVDALATNADGPGVGSTPFQVMYPGDYEYQKGMVGVRIRSADTSGSAGILGLTLNVDVPDVTDRGSADIGSGEESGVTVDFAKVFNVPPEVYPVFIEGPTAALPELVDVTTTGFTFILRDLNAPATLVQGSISWAAIGR